MAPRPSPVFYPLIAVIEDRSWSEFALCRGRSELFFEPPRELAPEREAREQAAKRMCDECAVQVTCLEAGRRNHECGIWGGETEAERMQAGFPIRTVTRTTLLAGRKPRKVVEAQPATAADPEVA